jgi:4-oxalomesaconate tautomerase
MPVVCLQARDVGLTGDEDPTEIESNTTATARIEQIRLAAGPLMNLGDVRSLTVPKMSMLSAPRNGGVVSTRTLIPHRVHDAIGVFGAVSVATACMIPGSVAAGVAVLEPRDGRVDVDFAVEHPTGSFTVTMDVEVEGGDVTVHRAALLRTARLLMRGQVFVPASIWEQT